MPPKNKRQSTKKNKKKGNTTASNNEAPPNSNRSTKQYDVNEKDFLFPGGLPDNFHEYEDGRKKSIQASYTSVYTRYKKATREFVNFMIQNTPEWVAGNRNSVDFLLTAAEWMVENRFEIHANVMRDLKLAIRLRKRVGESLYGGGDVGHKYFIDILVFCWSHLLTLPRLKDKQRIQVESDENEKYTRNKNSYEALMFDEEDEDEAAFLIDEVPFPSVPVPRPKLQAEQQPWTIDELMKSDDRTDSILFLFALDDFMGAISYQYKSLAQNCSRHEQSTEIIEDLLEAATTANMTIQQVQQLEMEFITDHEHINTPYRMLSAIVLPEITFHTCQIVKNHGKEWTGRIEQDVFSFLGDCLECTFRNQEEKADALISDFCHRYEMNPSGFDEITKWVQGVFSITKMEVPLMAEIPILKKQLELAKSLGQNHKLPKSHTWLSNMEYIGGDRAIHHTLRLLQSFSKIIESTPNDKKILNRPGFFGPSPSRPERARKIHGDLDEYLMADILPQWFLMCRHGIIGQTNIPHEPELCPLFVLLRDYVQKPHKPVTWSLVFAVHALLTATLDAAPAYNVLMNMSDAVFQNYFQQLDHAFKFITKEKDTRLTASFAQNMGTVSFLKNLGLDKFGRKALWNPLCASTTLLTLSYFGNMEVGCALIDCRAQLRITLHLFHALKVLGLVREGQIPFLDILNQYFKSSRGVWEGPLPRRGEFVKRFWICFGMSATDSKQMSEEAKISILDRRIGNNTKQSWGRGKGRKMSPIEPSELLTSYRRICNRDFHDVVDKYHSDEQRARMKDTEIYGLAVRTNDTMDAIADENALLALNLPAVGLYLEQFVCSLFRVLQFDSMIDCNPSLMDEDRRPGYIMLFVLSVLGALDFAPDPESYEFVEHFPVGTVCESFMNSFFNSIPVDNLMWFQGTFGPDNTKPKLKLINGYRR
eukprot:CAMPEP_0176479332 /NCGR_PEP_ID=MMETSP0200_2-20121128/1684_1 /TAXON_ID=947934 /ORGANISM="Chaetoceros sp., Strain GSL56" /LENGTH=932 /DNA_ID=CAMNT_0017875371 /DNA_START=150 /DNA_END=2948 /DNA_ORIENTATION=+